MINDRLGLLEGLLEALHAQDQQCNSEARLIRVPAMPRKASADRPMVGVHSNFGSLAFLHNVLGGLQVILPGETEWKYVRPMPRYTICNVGDALSIFSGGIFKSYVHGVVPRRVYDISKQGALRASCWNIANGSINACHLAWRGFCHPSIREPLSCCELPTLG